MTDLEVSLDTVLRNDLLALIEKVISHFEQGFIPGLYLNAIAYRLQMCLDGKIKRLIINIPPRYGKSLSCSVAFPAYVLGRDPSKKIICASYGQNLSTDLAIKFETITQQPWYQSAFPKFEIGKKSTTEFIRTSKEGYRYSTSTNGSTTGIGADILLADDITKANSTPNERLDANLWMGNTFLSRLNNKETGVAIVVMHRTHVDDTTAYLLAQGGWDLLSLPAIAPEDQHIPIGDGLFFDRVAGSPLHAERENLSTLAQIRKDVTDPVFAAQYLQDPASSADTIFKKKWFNYYDQDYPNHWFEYVVQSWDTASSAGKNSARSVCTVWGVRHFMGKNNILFARYYLLYVWKGQPDYDQLRAVAFKLICKHPPTHIIIENKDVGRSLLQQLYAKLGNGVMPYNPTESKEERANIVLYTLQEGRVYLRKDASYLEEYLNEMTTFPNSIRNDQVDSTTQFLRHAIYPIQNFYKINQNQLAKFIEEGKYNKGQW